MDILETGLLIWFVNYPNLNPKQFHLVILPRFTISVIVVNGHPQSDGIADVSIWFKVTGQQKALYSSSCQSLHIVLSQTCIIGLVHGPSA